MPTQIVAEIAQGFEGRPEQAMLMIKAAAASKADAVKFQLVIADELSTPDYEHYELFTTLEMDTAVWQDMKTSCDQLGVELVFEVLVACNDTLETRKDGHRRETPCGDAPE